MIRTAIAYALSLVQLVVEGLLWAAFGGTAVPAVVSAYSGNWAAAFGYFVVAAMVGVFLAKQLAERR